MDVVIMAGGKGTRIASVNSEVPKPMIQILGKPILEYQIETLRNQGFTNIIIVVGYLGHIIRDYFKDGTKFGVNITYIIEDLPLGTAGALFFLNNKISEDFLLINGDVIFDVDINRFLMAHKKYGATVTLLTHPNNHPYDSGIIISNYDNIVTNWLHKEDYRVWYKNRVNSGIHMISPSIFKQFTELKKLDLDRDILKPMIKSGKLFVYDSTEYIKDMGTPERYQSVIEDMESGKVFERNLNKKQKAIFLDRDGTINKYVGFLKDIEQFELIDKVADAIRKINKSSYLAIIISNQPVIARGDLTFEELNEIHNKMETLLGNEGAYVDGIYYCPHHPDKGFAGELIEYKIQCECRKPKTGMFINASKDYNIDLSKSWMIGDSDTDMIAGEKAGCRTVKLGGSKKYMNFENLSECVNYILKEDIINNE